MAYYIKGNAVTNATKYVLLEKVNGVYTALAEASEINFEVSALGLDAGDHVLVVKAVADGYEDSEYSNEVTYTVSESSSGETTTYYTVTYNYVDSDGTTIATSTTESVVAGTSMTFSTSSAPTIDGYTISSVSPTSVTVNSDITVAYTYSTDTTSGDGEEIDISSLFSSTFEAGAMYADPTSTNFGGAHSSQTAYYCNLSNSSYVNISEYAGKTLEITLPYATASSHAVYGIVFYTATGKTNAISDVEGTTIPYVDGSTGAETREIVIPSTAKYARTTWLTPDNETACGVSFSAKIIS